MKLALYSIKGASISSDRLGWIAGDGRVPVASLVTLSCAKLQSDSKPLEKRTGVPDEVYEAGLLEHPAIPGLMLTKDERLYSKQLPILYADGVERIETLDEKRFRIKWQRPIPVADTESRKNFVRWHPEAFEPRRYPSRYNPAHPEFQQCQEDQQRRVETAAVVTASPAVHTKLSHPQRSHTAPAAAQAIAPAATGEFGLLATEGAAVKIQPGAGFFNMDAAAEPEVPATEMALHCAALMPGIEALEKRDGVANAVYEDGLLEHPVVPGLWLTKDERLYGARLEIIDSDGVMRVETLDEKRYRIKWKRPIPPAETESKKDFVKMRETF